MPDLFSSHLNALVDIIGTRLSLPAKQTLVLSAVIILISVLTDKMA